MTLLEARAKAYLRLRIGPKLLVEIENLKLGKLLTTALVFLCATHYANLSKLSTSPRIYSRTASREFYPWIILIHIIAHKPYKKGFSEMLWIFPGISRLFYKL